MQIDQIFEWTISIRSFCFQCWVQEGVPPTASAVLVHSFQRYQEQVQESYYLYCSLISFSFLVQLLNFSFQKEVLKSFCDSILRSFSTMKHYHHILIKIYDSGLHYEKCCYESFTTLNQRMDCATEAFRLSLSQQYQVDLASIYLTQFQLVLLESLYGGLGRIL